MIACLPMYDMPHASAAYDRLWSAIAAQLPGAPAHLTREGDLWVIWQSPDLLLAQTCGLPYRAKLHGKVTLVGTPDYNLPSCPPGYYCSVTVIRAGRSEPPQPTDTIAYNDPLSQSGWAAAQAVGLGQGDRLETGSHAASAQAVAEGRAAVACLDALTWRMLQVEEPELCAQIQVAGATPPTPGLPFITSKDRDPAPIFAALTAAIGTLSAQDRDLLHLQGCVEIPAKDYLALPIPDCP